MLEADWAYGLEKKKKDRQLKPATDLGLGNNILGIYNYLFHVLAAILYDLKCSIYYMRKFPALAERK